MKRHQFSTCHLSHLPILRSQIEFADLIASLFGAPKSSSVQISLHFPSPHFTKTTLAEVTLRLSCHTLLLTTPFLKSSPSVWIFLATSLSWLFFDASGHTFSVLCADSSPTAGVRRSPRLTFSSHLRL